MNTQPILLTAIYSLSSDSVHAALRFKGLNAHSLMISVLHESISDVVVHDLHGDEEGSELEVQDAETLTVLVRNAESRVIACGVFEVKTALVAVGALLAPCTMSNLLFEQVDDYKTAPLFDEPDDLPDGAAAQQQHVQGLINAMAWRVGLL